jgi:hypothetical protein
MLKEMIGYYKMKVADIDLKYQYTQNTDNTRVNFKKISNH